MVTISKIGQYVIDKVRERRQELGMSQAELSTELDKTASFISGYETTKTGKHYNIEQLNELAKAFRCSPKYFRTAIVIQNSPNKPSFYLINNVIDI